MSRRDEILAERARRAPLTGPERRKRPMAIEDVDTERKLDCAKYDECLTEMAIVGCRGWACPDDCPWYRPAAPAPIEWRTDEPFYDLGLGSAQTRGGGVA